MSQLKCQMLQTLLNWYFKQQCHSPSSEIRQHCVYWIVTNARNWYDKDCRAPNCNLTTSCKRCAVHKCTCTGTWTYVDKTDFSTTHLATKYHFMVMILFMSLTPIILRLLLKMEFDWAVLVMTLAFIYINWVQDTNEGNVLWVTRWLVINKKTLGYRHCEPDM